VAAPPSRPGDLMAALSAESVLPEPEADKQLPLFWVSFHLQVKPTLKVRFPLRVVGVSPLFDLDMSYDGDGRCIKEPGDLRSAVGASVDSPEDIPCTVEATKVFLVDPPRRFFGVSSASPFPQAVEDS